MQAVMPNIVLLPTYAKQHIPCTPLASRHVGADIVQELELCSIHAENGWRK